MAYQGKTTGLRFLWIPGKKKHQHKGRYDTVNKQPVHGHHQKKTEPWSLGGSKGHEELVKTSDLASEAGSSCVTAALPAATYAIGATAVNQTNEMEHMNGNAPTNPVDCSDEGDHGRNNAATLLISTKMNGATKKLKLNSSGDGGLIYENNKRINGINHDITTSTHGSRSIFDLPSIPSQRLEHGLTDVSMYKSRFQPDLDSIERFGSDQVDAQKMIDIDPKNLTCGYVDTKIAIGNNNKCSPTSNVSRNKSPSAGKPGEKEENEKTVNCLYYTLQCCECTIS